VPESDFSQRILANTQNVAFIVVGVTLLASLFALFISQRGFVKPLTEIIEQTHQLANFNLSDIRPVNSCITEIHNLAISVVQMGAGLGSFGKYLPAGLVKTLLANGVVAKPYAEKRTMSVLFMDLAGFTTISEALGPKIVPYLDRYFGAMTAEIEAVDGTIDKFIGDCVMAFWGAPFYDEEHPAKACAAALNCLETLEMLRGEWPAEWASKLDVRIGVNTGRVIVGNIGSHARINYTVVGDPVNLASRLESGCKGYGIRCMIGQSTYELAKYDIVARRLDVTHVKGKNEPVVVYELLAMADDVKDRSQYAWVDVYDEALSAFTAGDIAKARAGFLKTIELRGEDPPSSLFLERCQ
jgi:adenylate cyclase